MFESIYRLFFVKYGQQRVCFNRHFAAWKWKIWRNTTFYFFYWRQRNIRVKRSFFYKNSRNQRIPEFFWKKTGNSQNWTKKPFKNKIVELDKKKKTLIKKSFQSQFYSSENFAQIIFLSSNLKGRIWLFKGQKFLINFRNEEILVFWRSFEKKLHHQLCCAWIFGKKD